MNIIEFVGKRVLGKSSRSVYGRDAEVTEFRILEVSPSGNWIKLQNLYGNKFWKPITDFSLVEELIEFRLGGNMNKSSNIEEEGEKK